MMNIMPDATLAGVLTEIPTGIPAEITELSIAKPV